MKAKVLIFLLVFVVSGCNTNVDTSELERDVYASLLSYMSGDKAKILVIREDSTTNNNYLGKKIQPQKMESEEAYLNFVAMNKVSSRLPIDASWNSKVRILNKEELHNIFNKSSLRLSWKSFHEKYHGAGGIIELSRVGFNKDLNRAFLYVDVVCGELCGNGYYAWLSKGVFGWKVDVLEHLWVS